MAERNHRLIDGKVMKYLLPSVMMTMALQLGNVVDTILVGNLLGTQAMSAIRLCLPMMTVEQLLGYGLGTGAAVCVGILLGKRDRQGASRIFSTVFWLTLAVGLLFMAAAFPLAGPIANLLARGGELTELTRQYIFIWMLGGPIVGVGLYLTNFMGLDSHPELASGYIIVSNVINLILDYIFLAWTPLGIMGAALSTMIGLLAGMVVFVRYFRSKDRTLKLEAPKTLSPVLDAAKAGVPTIIYMGMTFVESLGSNYIILGILGIDGMTIYTVCKNVLLIMLMTTGGIIGVIPSLSGVLYGERDYYGLRAVCVRTLKITAAATAVVLLVVMTFTGAIAGMFGIRQGPLLQHTVPAMRCFMLCLPFYVWNKFLTSYYQSIEQTKMASMITFLQGGVIMLPAAYLGITLGLRLGRTGLNAMGLSFLASEGLTALAVMVYRKIKHPGKGVFILPGNNSGDCLDVTIQAKPEAVTALARQVLDFCLGKGVERTLANRMTVAAEEMMQNAIAYGGARSEWIDFCVAVDEQQIRLRIRDNGVPFDPTSYVFDGEDFDISGIEIVKRIASRVSYVRAIDLNNTVIEINRQEAEETPA